MTFLKKHPLIVVFNLLYLIIGGLYFLRDLNHEFVIYVLVIVGLLGFIFATHHHSKFPAWMLWLFSFWGLMHVLGGAVETRDGVLFAYRIYPLLDLGGDFYVLKYDQVVHFYLYGVFAIMFHHIFRSMFKVRKYALAIAFFAVLAAVGFSALNEIMEFLIAISLERNGVGGYHNAMLDLIFNLAGAITGVALLRVFGRRH